MSESNNAVAPMTAEQIAALLKTLTENANKMQERRRESAGPRQKRLPPYYKESAAVEAKAHIDALFERGRPVIIPRHGRSMNTVRLMFYQGLDFLLEHMDPDGVYAERRMNMEVSFANNEYGILKLKKRHGILPADFDWKSQVKQFLSVAKKHQILELYGAHFTAEDFQWVDRLFTPDTDWMKTFDWAGLSGFTIIRAA